MGKEPQGVHRHVRRPGRQAAANSSADWSWHAESDRVSAISFGCSTRPTVAIAAELHCTRYDCGSYVKRFPSIHIWDWDTHSTSLLTPPSSNLSSSSASIAKAPFTSSASHFFISPTSASHSRRSTYCSRFLISLLCLIV